MSKSEVVVKSNQVIEASYQLSTIEQRLVLAAIAHIPKNQEVSDEVVYTVGVSDLQALGVNETTAYRDLKEGLNRLYERSINIMIDGKSIKMRWVQSIQFMDSRGEIGLRFSKDILPFISNLSREFTKYALSDIAGMSSAYAIRIYELITQYKSLGEREIAVTDLRNMLELGTRYPLFADLKRWVIDTAVNQINDHSPLQVSYEVSKTGRKVSHITFSFKGKKIKDITPKNEEKHKRDKDTPDLFTGLTDKQAAFFASKLANDSEFQANAQVGEEMVQFIERIKQELLDSKSFEKYLPALNKHGFRT